MAIGQFNQPYAPEVLTTSVTNAVAACIRANKELGTVFRATRRSPEAPPVARPTLPKAVSQIGFDLVHFRTTGRFSYELEAQHHDH